MDIEVCIENIESGMIAANHGATRVELCSALDLGGLTPSAGMIKSCVQNCSLQVYVMIRPKAGDFVYNENQFDIMKKDIVLAAESGADGVVFGCLTDRNELDIEKNRALLSLAKSWNLGVTFHRAFDFVANTMEAFNLLEKLGFDRILTSGGKSTAIEGLEQIKELAKIKSNIEIMAGSGINAENCYFFDNTGIDAVHFTARKPKGDSISLNMGSNYITDTKKIKGIINYFNK